MRIAVAHIICQADAFQKLIHASFDLVLWNDAICNHRLGDDVTDAHARVQGSIGVLEDELDVLAVALALGVLHRGEVFTVKDNLATRGAKQVHEHLANGGLAAPRLAHKAERLSPLNLEAYVVHRMHIRRRLAEEVRLSCEELRQMLHIEQHVIVAQLRARNISVIAHQRLPPRPPAPHRPR